MLIYRYSVIQEYRNVGMKKPLEPAFFGLLSQLYLFWCKNVQDIDNE